MKADLSSAVETLVNTNENRLFPVYSLDPRSYILLSLCILLPSCGLYSSLQPTARVIVYILHTGIFFSFFFFIKSERWTVRIM